MYHKHFAKCIFKSHFLHTRTLDNFYTVKIVFYSSSMNDGEFINFRYTSFDKVTSYTYGEHNFV